MFVADFGRKEVYLLVRKLTLLADDAGLRGWEVERLIAVHPGVWPIPPARFELWVPTKDQERRIRMLVEVLANVAGLFGPEMRTWMRLRNVGIGTSPARFLLSDREALPAMRNALRLELEQY